MKKFFFIISILLFLNTHSYASKYGEGDLQLTGAALKYFKDYLRGGYTKKPADFYITLDGTDAIYWTCSEGSCKEGDHINDIKICEQVTGKKCKKFALRRVVKWKNGINTGHYKKSAFNSKWSDQEIENKLNELGFYKNKTAKKIENQTDEKSKKVVKKYELKGERVIALSWEGYNDLLAGTVKFDESNYKGTLKLLLPDNNGNCEGSYSLQKNGKGTWQISCSNNMGAAGTLKWVKGGSVTGSGRDHNDKKVKFTVSSRS